MVDSGLTPSAFPADDYTPHGYLANPHAVAHSWSESEGGCLRTSREYLGLGWQLPWPQGAQAGVDLIVTLESEGRHLVGRADFADTKLTSPHHSARLFVYRWVAFGRRWEAAYTLVEMDPQGENAALGLEVSWEPLIGEKIAQDVVLTLTLVGWRRPDKTSEPVSLSPRPDGWFSLGKELGWIGLQIDGGPVPDWRLPVGAEPSGRAGAAARYFPPSRQRPEILPGGDISSMVAEEVERARLDDDELWRGAARLEGDWPASWRRGWVYDVETTRMCVYPPGGIFTDVWPAWMVQWPRAVVAEGTLDMARFAYSSPDLAQRATLSLFRDAEAPNVPCVFQHGEPNMVASDGSICGTSPAWCIPFYNLERLFALTLDRAWLAEIYPYLARYVEWWLSERTDRNGWAVYKCTWEAGEDDTPRLDPERRGDNVVSAFVRPVELQATMALSAGVLARFAAVLGEDEDVRRWRQVEATYLAKTRELWDPIEGRFRDWDARTGRFLAPAGEANYWGIDPCRFSALAFTPLLAGLTDDAYRDGLRRELRHYDSPPWSLWASWSYVVLEASRLTGDTAFAGRVAGEIVGRVYGELDARDPAGPNHPTPGVAREYWPLDLDTWASCEGYGWGANTASLLVRQVFGFLEGPYLDVVGASTGAPAIHGSVQTPGWRASSLSFELRPALPADFLVPGREYWLVNLPYRGARLSLGYRVAETGGTEGAEPGALTLLVSANTPTRCRIVEPGPGQSQASDDVRELHELVGRNGGIYRVELSLGR